MLSSLPVGAVVGGTAVDAASVLLQVGEFQQQQPQLDPTQQALGSFVLTLVVGGILLAAAPTYVERLTGDINAEPLESFGWGLLVFVGFIGAVFLLAITVVGLVLVFPLLLIFIVVALVGNVLAYVALLGRVVDSEWQALVAGAVVAGATNLVPGIGGLVGFVVGAIGIGAVVRDWRS